MHAEAQIHEEVPHSSKEHFVSKLESLFAEALTQIPGVQVESSGNFFVRGELPFVQKKLLADANSKMFEWLEAAYIDFMRMTPEEKRHDVAEVFRGTYRGNKAEFLKNEAGFPDMVQLFERVATKPDLKLVP